MNMIFICRYPARVLYLSAIYLSFSRINFDIFSRKIRNICLIKGDMLLHTHTHPSNRMELWSYYGWRKSKRRNFVLFFHSLCFHFVVVLFWYFSITFCVSIWWTPARTQKFSIYQNLKWFKLSNVLFIKKKNHCYHSYPGVFVLY